jgi:hypothetical protein
VHRVRVPIAFLASLVAMLAWAPSSSAQGTIGAPLDQAPNTNVGCEGFALVGPPPPSCTFFGFDNAGSWTSQVPSGRWTMTLGRVRTGPRVGPMVFTAVRAFRSQAGGGGGIICCQASVESQVFTPTPNAVNEIPVQLPVQNVVENVEGEPVEVTDYIGLSLLDLNSSAPFVLGGNASVSYWAPALRPSPEVRNQDGSLAATLLVNAVLCPASRRAAAPRQGTCSDTGGGGTGSGDGGGTGGGGGDGSTVPDGFGLASKSTLKAKNGKATLTFDVPGPGDLEIADPRDPGDLEIVDLRANRGERAAARAKKPLVKRTSATAAEAGELKVPLKLTKTGKGALKKKAKKGKKLGVKIDATFTPEGGEPASDELKVKLKGKKGKRG